jgi:hypothetical protein
MKQMFTTLAEAFKEDPKEVIVSALTMIGLFVGLWAGLWLIAICEGRV